MKSLIIIKGLVKKDKLTWVKSEGLSNFFIELDDIKKKFSTPELSYSGNEILGNSFSTDVNTTFLKIVCTRLRKGGLLVLDIGEELGSTIEDLAIVFGYTIFYKVFPIPQDYLGKPKKYSLTGFKTLSRPELENNIMRFLNTQLSDNIIETYQDIVKWWDNTFDFKIDLKDKDTLLHVSDLHSNFNLLKQVNFDNYDYVLFHGDYIDGPEKGGSRLLMDYVINTGTKKERIFLEGNHEMRLRRFLGYSYFKEKHKDYLANILIEDIPIDFIDYTGKEFNNIKGYSAIKYIQEMNKILKTHIILKRNNDTYICTHSGLKNLNVLQPKYIGNIIYGNRDMNKYDKEFSIKYKNKDIYSVHAHCKYPDKWEVNRYSNVFNIDPEDENKIVLMENKTWKLWELEK